MREPKRVGVLVVSHELLLDALNLPEGHTVLMVWEDRLTGGVFNVKVAGPSMPICGEGNEAQMIPARRA